MLSASRGTQRAKECQVTVGEQKVECGAETREAEAEDVREVEGNEDDSAVIGWILAEADEGNWWQRFRVNPKRLGEVSQAAFLLKAEMMGYNVALPWGDSERSDFIVWRRNGGRPVRVQVKGTGRLHRRGYEVQPVRSSRGRGKRRYTKKEIDIIAAHVQPLDAWYLIPIEALGRTKSLRLYPDIKSHEPMWEKWREKWEVLGRK